MKEKMLTIPVDAANAFDALSILELKQSLYIDDKKAFTNYDQLKNHLCDLLGYEKFRDIFFSKEYDDLYEINKEIYRLVALAEKDEVKASDVTKANNERFLSKKLLQNKFFQKEEFNEQKF
jgi:hypothetical protein